MINSIERAERGGLQMNSLFIVIIISVVFLAELLMRKFSDYYGNIINIKIRNWSRILFLAIGFSGVIYTQVWDYFSFNVPDNKFLFQTVAFLFICLLAVHLLSPAVTIDDIKKTASGMFKKDRKKEFGDRSKYTTSRGVKEDRFDGFLYHISMVVLLFVLALCVSFDIMGIFEELIAQKEIKFFFSVIFECGFVLSMILVPMSMRQLVYLWNVENIKEREKYKKELSEKTKRKKLLKKINKKIWRL